MGFFGEALLGIYVRLPCGCAMEYQEWGTCRMAADQKVLVAYLTNHVRVQTVHRPGWRASKMLPRLTRNFPRSVHAGITSRQVAIAH